MRKVSLFILAMIAIALLLVACGNKETNAITSDSNVLETSIIGGRTGGEWSVFTEGIAESIRRENKDAVITVEPGSIVENPPTVGMGIVPYGISYSMTAYAAYRGSEPYDDAYEDIRAVSVVIPDNYYQLVVDAHSGYESFDEIIENKAPIRLAVDQNGSAGEIITRTILQSYGVTYDDIKDWGGTVDYLGGSKAFELMADERIDATGDAVTIPSSDIIEAETKMDVNMLSIREEVVKEVGGKLGMDVNFIDSDSYTFLQQDIQTVSTPAILIVHKNVPEEEVYQVTKAIYENLSYLSSVHAEFGNLTAEMMANVGSLALHPGAEKFFNEQGLLD